MNYQQLCSVLCRRFCRLHWSLCFLLLFWSIGGTSLAYADTPQEVGGRLSNGLGYIIRKNGLPQHKTEFRLIYRIGSIVEQDSERGYAHFLEHLAFGGTEHFPQSRLISYVESLGTRYGVGLNAYTGYDRTIYMMSLPMDAPQRKVLDSALLILKDWLYGISIDSVAVERERGIVREEIRAFVEQDPFYSLKMGVGVESRRLPIATMPDIDAIDWRRLRAFYHRWYQPELATLLIVGDVDPREVEQQLRHLFEHHPQGTPTPKVKTEPLSYAPGVSLQHLTDSLSGLTKIELIAPAPALRTSTPREMATSALWNIALRAWRNRMATSSPASVERAWYLGATDHIALTMEDRGGQELMERISLAFAWLRRLEQKGISKFEFEALRQQALQKYRTLPEEMTSESWCNYYTDHILMGDLLLTSPKQIEQIGAEMSLLSRSDLRKIFGEIRQLYKKHTLLTIVANAPQSGQGKLTKEAVAMAMSSGKSRSLPPYRYQVPEPLPQAEDISPAPLPSLLQRGWDSTVTSPHIVAEQYHPKIDTYVCKFANGLRLIMHPMPKGEGIKATLLTPGGYATIPKGQETLLEGVAGYMEMGGVQGIPNDSLQSYLYSHELALSLTPAPYSYGIMGSAPTAELVPLLQLIYHKAQHPDIPYQDFEEVRSELLRQTQEPSPSTLTQLLSRNPHQRMERIIDSLMHGSLYFPEAKDSLSIQALSIDSMANFHRRLLSTTEGATLLLSGNFSVPTARAVVADLWGSLPKTPPLPTTYSGYIDPLPKELSIEPATSVDEPTTVYNLYYGNYSPSLRSSLRLKLMRELLRNRMIKYLRTEAGLIYTPYLSVFYRAYPTPQAYFVLETSVGQANVNRANQLMGELIEELQQVPAPDQELEDIKQTFLINKREALTDSDVGAWQDALLGLIRHGEEVADFAEYQSLLGSISAEEVRRHFAEFFHPSGHRTYYIGLPGGGG